MEVLDLPRPVDEHHDGVPAVLSHKLIQLIQHRLGQGPRAFHNQILVRELCRHRHESLLIQLLPADLRHRVPAPQLPVNLLQRGDGNLQALCRVSGLDQQMIRGCCLRLVLRRDLLCLILRRRSIERGLLNHRGTFLIRHREIRSRLLWRREVRSRSRLLQRGCLPRSSCLLQGSRLLRHRRLFRSGGYRGHCLRIEDAAAGQNLPDISEHSGPGQAVLLRLLPGSLRRNPGHLLSQTLLLSGLLHLGLQHLIDGRGRLHPLGGTSGRAGGRLPGLRAAVVQLRRLLVDSPGIRLVCGLCSLVLRLGRRGLAGRLLDPVLVDAVLLGSVHLLLLLLLLNHRAFL